ncbi:MAG: heme o synthase [Candidatus Thorarchaeota archaeon]|nr:heme o synthase [Candidatus Thorarchaeota archaeon]
MSESSTPSKTKEDSTKSSMFGLYGELIKSKQTVLLVYTTGFAYLMSTWNVGINLLQALLLIVGLTLAVSGSTLLNMYIDRDIDAVMIRTQNRPIPSGKIAAWKVLIHGIILVALGVITCGLFINQVTMIIVFLGFFLDVVVYSVWLKRKSPASILFGGIAGGMPALAGRTAVIGMVDLTGIMMALFVISWIPLHILTLALLPDNLAGYKEAGVPMWPVVRGEHETMVVITISAVISAVVVVLTGMVMGLHWVVMLPLLILSLVITARAVSNLRGATQEATFWIFKMASMYMGFAFLWLFVGIVITPFFVTLVPWP